MVFRWRSFACLCVQGAFVEDLDASQLAVLWNGEVILTNLKLKRLVFSSLPVPVQVRRRLCWRIRMVRAHRRGVASLCACVFSVQIKEGVIERLVVTLPWPLFNSPVKFSLHGCHVLVTGLVAEDVHAPDMLASSLAQLAQEIRRVWLRVRILSCVHIHV